MGDGRCSVRPPFTDHQSLPGHPESIRNRYETLAVHSARESRIGALLNAGRVNTAQALTELLVQRGNSIWIRIELLQNGELTHRVRELLTSTADIATVEASLHARDVSANLSSGRVVANGLRGVGRYGRSVNGIAVGR